MKLSVIVANYNYGPFIAETIESALALDWDDVEIIVVDDGSTDNSREVIESYGDRVIAIFQENSGQRNASNTGYARSTGDWIIFLDSDDLVDPSIIREVEAVWTPNVSKVQFQMDRINGKSELVGSRFPIYDPLPTPAKIKDWAVRLNGYPTPPGSGNVYSRAFLDQVFPVDNTCGESPDSALITAAPYYGEVVTVDKPLVRYRVHGGNDSDLFFKQGRFAREVVRGQGKFIYSQRIAALFGIVIPDSDFNKNLHLMQHRIPSLIVNKALHPIAGDTKGKVLKDLVTSTLAFDAMSIKRRFVLFVWGALTLISPTPVAKSLIKKRFRG